MGLVFNKWTKLLDSGLQGLCMHWQGFVCEYESVSERRESVAMHFYMSSHWSLHIKHDGRTQLNMSHFQCDATLLQGKKKA